jgi:nitrate/nitrite-specific signal transduction histidine kinase
MEQPHAPRKEMMPLKRPQMKIVLLVGCALFLTCMVVSVLQTYFLLTALRSRVALQGEMASEVWLVTSLVALITLLVMVPVFMFIAVWISYRILGPIRRMAREMESVGEGRIGGGFALRTGDDLIFLAVSLSAMKEGLARRLAACREAENAVDQAVQRVEFAASAGAGGELGPAVAQLRQALAGLHAGLEQFKA